MTSERKPTGHWVLDHRPMGQAEMILPEKLNQTLRQFSSGPSPKKLLIVGGAGTGKTLLAEQLSGPEHNLVALQEVESLEQMQALMAARPSHTHLLKRSCRTGPPALRRFSIGLCHVTGGGFP